MSKPTTQEAEKIILSALAERAGQLRKQADSRKNAGEGLAEYREWLREQARKNEEILSTLHRHGLDSFAIYLKG